MALITGQILRLGVITGAEPIGRITLRDDTGTEQSFQCSSGPKFDLAVLAMQAGYRLEVDVLATTNPMIADKVRVT